MEPASIQLAQMWHTSAHPTPAQLTNNNQHLPVRMVVEAQYTLASHSVPAEIDSASSLLSGLEPSAE